MPANELKELVTSIKVLLSEGGEISMPHPPDPQMVEPLGKAEALGHLSKNVIGECRRCALSQSRSKIVFGVGDPEAQVMFVGEGPGFDEDKKGEPFVGKAGQLLDKIIESIGLRRSGVFIANVVKCHPLLNPRDPGKRGNDRAPLPSEIEQCFPFLKQQILIIRPRIIVALGATAARTLLMVTEGITRLRGRTFSFDLGDRSPAIPVLPTYHPAALLRDPSLKKFVWEDMKKLRDFLKMTENNTSFFVA